MKRPVLTLACLSLLAFALAMPLDGLAAKKSKKLYRYINAEGNVVVASQVPAEYVRGGYEVINDEGDVLDVVKPDLTPEDRAKKQAEREAAEEAERLREWDESLLLRYSSVEDIEEARDRALDNLRIRMSILSSNRRSLIQQIENYQAEAAEVERSGGKVDSARLRNIKELQNQIGVTERAIVDRQQEIEELSVIYQADIERFGKLQEMVDFRRAASN